VTTLLILTKPRGSLEDPYQYLRQTIAQIDRENAPVEKGIVCDGDYSGPRPPGWEVFEYFRPPGALPFGNKLPYWHLLSLGYDAGGELLALEDDLTFCHNAIRRMASFLIPADLAWVQFFSPQILMDAQMYPGLWRPPISSHLFLQAVKYSHETLARLMDFNEHPEWGMFSTSDQSIALASERLGLDYGVHAPDLCQHAGDLSLANPGASISDLRISKMWPGQAFDSLGLYSADYLFR
jgi:hypothetical protein